MYTASNIFSLFYPYTHRTVLIDFTIFCSFDGGDLISSFADDKDGDSAVLDFTVHCLRYDDAVHKEDSLGYRVFLTTGFFVSFYLTPSTLPPSQLYMLVFPFLILC